MTFLSGVFWGLVEYVLRAIWTIFLLVVVMFVLTTGIFYLNRLFDTVPFDWTIWILLMAVLITASFIADIVDRFRYKETNSSLIGFSICVFVLWEALLTGRWNEQLELFFRKVVCPCCF